MQCGAEEITSRVQPTVPASLALSGLTAHLDKLVHHHGGPSLPPGRPHAFVYFITIRNASDRTVTLLGRKWIIAHADGTSLVVEGDKIVGLGVRSVRELSGSLRAKADPTKAKDLPGAFAEAAMARHARISKQKP